MNEDTTTAPAIIVKGALKEIKRGRKNRTPRAPRVIPPEEQAIRDRAKAEIQTYRQGLKSGGVLKRIQALVPKLTREHVRLLISQLDKAERELIAKETV